MIMAFFKIEDDNAMEVFKSKLINSQSDPELKKELIAQVSFDFRGMRSSTREYTSQVREVLGDEKYDQYRGYDVSIETELTPAMSIIQEAYPRRGGNNRGR